MQAVTPDIPAMIWAATKYEALWLWQHKEMVVGGYFGIRKLIRHARKVVPGIIHEAVGSALKAHEDLDDQRFRKVESDQNAGFDTLKRSIDDISTHLRGRAVASGD